MVRFRARTWHKKRDLISLPFDCVDTKTIFINDLDKSNRKFVEKKLARISNALPKFDLFIKVELFLMSKHDDHYRFDFCLQDFPILHFPDSHFSQQFQSLKYTFNHLWNGYVSQNLNNRRRRRTKGFKIEIFRKKKLLTLEEACFVSSLRTGGIETLPRGLRRLLFNKYKVNHYYFPDDDDDREADGEN